VSDTSSPLSVLLDGTPAEVEPAVTEALAAQGFGVLTRIDVSATLKTKIDADLEEYVILGACNPPLAHRAIEADPAIGALLPCNVVLREDGADTIVEAMDPLAVLGILDTPAIHAVAEEAAARLRRAVAALEPTA
jgi:uncharacterized protein (DUF302 family)